MISKKLIAIVALTTMVGMIQTAQATYLSDLTTVGTVGGVLGMLMADLSPLAIKSSADLASVKVAYPALMRAKLLSLHPLALVEWTF